MRNGQNGRRRGRGSNRPQQQGGNRAAEVARQDARVRGNAQQLLEKYKNLARDAASSGDRILSEYYMQHADHYYRVLAEFRSRYEDQRPQERGYQDRDEHGDDDYESDHAQDDGAEPQRTGRERPEPESAPPAAEHPALQAPPIETAPPAEPDPQAEPDAAATEPPRRRRGRPRKTERAEPAATDA